MKIKRIVTRTTEQSDMPNVSQIVTNLDESPRTLTAGVMYSGKHFPSSVNLSDVMSRMEAGEIPIVIKFYKIAMALLANTAIKDAGIVDTDIDDIGA